MKLKFLYLLLVPCLLGVVNADLLDGLVGYYTFDGNLQDTSGSANVNNGAAVGSPDLAVGGLFGGGVTVGDGSGTSYVSLGTPSDYLFGDSTSFTIAYWLKMPDVQASDPGLIGNKDWSASGLRQGFTQAIIGDDVKANVADGSTRADTSTIDLDHDVYWDGQGKDPLDPIRWTFVAMTVDRSSNVLTNYVMDGWVINQWDDSSTPQTVDISGVGSLDSGYPINIGQDGDGVGYDNVSYPELIATFDDMAVWRRALSTEELWGIYTAGRDGQSFGDYSGVPEPSLELAYNPNPPNGATDVCREVVLSWTSGEYADKHDVYFGTNFDDVNDATTTVDPYNVYKGRQDRDDNSYHIADTLDLDFAQTYYWRIDEVNAAPDYTIFKGSIWQFTTEPEAYPISGDKITATASSSYPGDDPNNTVNGSGLDGDLHSMDMSTMWTSDGESPGGAWIQYELDKVYKLHEMWVWNYNGDRNSMYGFKDVTIEYSTDGSNWMPLAGVHQFAQAPETEGYAHNTTVGFSVAAKYVKITADGNWQKKLIDPDYYGLSEVRFYYIPLHAREPNPADEATDVPLDVVLSWKAGREAAEHNVYFGTNFGVVNTGIIDPCTIPAADGCRASYGPLSLELGQTYYWRVDEVNMAEIPPIWKSDVWSFTTPEYFVVDDMEDYNDRAGIITVWRDGYTAGPVGNSGSNVTVSTESDDRDPRLTGDGPPWPVRDSEAMQFAYDNDGSIFLYVPGWLPYPYSADANYYSEAKAGIANLPIGTTNWTERGVKALTLWFYGDADNDIEQMWVKLTDQVGGSGKVTYGHDGEDPNGLKDPSWHEWNIALSDFGVDLTHVNDISIGFGDESNRTTPGGSGVVFFDDIRLYPSRCVLSLRSAEFTRIDYVEDCVIDYKELAVMAEDWLVVVGENPGYTNLVGWWKFDGNANDSSSSGIHGTLVGNPQYVAGWINGALEFDGDDHVVLGTSNDLNFGDATDFSVTLWVNTTGWQNDAAIISNKDWDSGSNTGWVIAGEGGGSGSWQWNYCGATGTRVDYDPPGPTLSDGEWHHLCITHDRDGYATFYFDGEYQDERNISGSTGTIDAGYPTVIGTDGAEGAIWPYWFVGLVDDVRIYNKVLTENELLYLIGLPVDLDENRQIDFKDYAVLADMWLDDQLQP